MKSFEEIQKEYTAQEIAESLVFPDDRSAEEREKALSELRKFRKKIADEQTKESKTISKLLQLKYTIEDYLNANSFNKDFYFGYFLQEYIQRLGKKNKEFAVEIDIDPTELSQVINKHRKPSEKHILRLEIHSNKNFPAIMWLKLLEKERIYELLNNKSLIDSERKYVKQKLEFSF